MPVWQPLITDMLAMPPLHLRGEGRGEERRRGRKGREKDMVPSPGTAYQHGAKSTAEHEIIHHPSLPNQSLPRRARSVQGSSAAYASLCYGDKENSWELGGPSKTCV